MTHLLQIALGPVQGFIATARRSRDLWFGSYILSELSKAAACSLHGKGAELIFPAPSLAADLKPDSELLVANIISAQLPSSGLEAARAVLEAARQDVGKRWEELCNKALKEVKPRLHSRDKPQKLALIRDCVWKAQLGDVVEFVCAAVPMAAGTSYREANDRLRNLMAQRKSTRDFTPYLENFHLPKSSLDGARSTVLAEFAGNEAIDARLARLRVGIDPDEQLDTPGMVKRVVGRARGFVPVARVASARWLQRANKEQPALLTDLITAYDGLRADGLATPLEGKYKEYGWVACFPYDAELLYPERVEAETGKLMRALEKKDRKAWDMDALAAVVKQLENAMLPLKREMDGTPQPYYGMLLADGDRMGALIDAAAGHADGLQMHRRVSSALARFAEGVPTLMANSGGACIYSGGDDVFGLVPLHCAMSCANALRQEFERALDAVAGELEIAAKDRPTLSVGIALVHMLEPLADVRELTRRAEALAKGQALASSGKDRNALALIAKPRSGAEYSCRIRWDEEAALERMGAWTAWLDAGKLPGGLPHELQNVWRECEGVFSATGDGAGDFARLWKARVTTVLDKKRQGDGEPLDKKEKDSLIAGLCPQEAASRDALDLLLLARWLGAHGEEVT